MNFIEKQVFIDSNNNKKNVYTVLKNYIFG